MGITAAIRQFYCSMSGCLSSRNILKIQILDKDDVRMSSTIEQDIQ
jgi:hypothetical protein